MLDTLLKYAPALKKEKCYKYSVKGGIVSVWHSEGLTQFQPNIFGLLDTVQEVIVQEKSQDIKLESRQPDRFESSGSMKNINLF